MEYSGGPGPDAEWLTPIQVGRKLQLTAKTVRELVIKGELPGIKIGNQWRINRRKLEQCLTSQLASGKTN